MMRVVVVILLSVCFYTKVYSYDANDPWSMYKDKSSILIPKIKSVQFTNGGTTFAKNNRDTEGHSNKVVWPTNDEDYTDIEVHFEEEDETDLKSNKPTSTNNKPPPSKISTPIPNKEINRINSDKNLEHQIQVSQETTDEKMVEILINKTLEHKAQINTITTTTLPPTQILVEHNIEHCKLLRALLLESQNIQKFVQESKEIITPQITKISTTRKPIVINKTKLVQDNIPAIQENKFQTVIPTEIISVQTTVTAKPTDVYRTFASNTIAKSIEKPTENIDKFKEFPSEQLENYKFEAHEAINIPVKSLNLKHIIQNVKENAYSRPDSLDYHQKEGTNINIILKESHDNHFKNSNLYSNHRYPNFNSNIRSRNSNIRPYLSTDSIYRSQQYSSNYPQFINPSVMRIRKQFDNLDTWTASPRKGQEEIQTQLNKNPSLDSKPDSNPSKFIIHEIQYSTTKPQEEMKIKNLFDFTTEKPTEPYFKYSTTKSMSKIELKPEITTQNPVEISITTTENPNIEHKVDTNLFQRPLLSQGEFRPSQPFNIVKYNVIDPTKFTETSIRNLNYDNTNLSEDYIRPPVFQLPKNIELLPNSKYYPNYFTDIYNSHPSQNFNIEKQRIIAHEFIDDRQDQIQHKNFNFDQQYGRQNHQFTENNYNFGNHDNWQGESGSDYNDYNTYGREMPRYEDNRWKESTLTNERKRLYPFIENGHKKDYGINEPFGNSNSWANLKDKLTRCKEKYQQLELKKIANRYYYIATERMSWHTAQQFCYKHGLELASIETYAENELLTAALRKNDPLSYYWLGGIDETFQKKWKWSGSKEEIKFFAWGQTEPNNRNGDEHCIDIHPQKSGKYNWSDFSCSFELKFVCELEHDDCDVNNIF